MARLFWSSAGAWKWLSLSLLLENPVKLIAHSDHLMLYLAGQSDSGKTNIYEVQNIHGASLGRITWFGAWRKYTFNPATGALLFDVDCLRQIADWLEEKTIEHRKKGDAR